MNIEEFKIKYAAFKDTDKVQITCDHPQHSPSGELITIGKQPAKRNILKNNGKQFVCRQCCMHFNNPMNQLGENRQTDEIVDVYCPHPDHKGDPCRQMKKNCYYGSLNEPFLQLCGSCVQKGKEISEDQREKIRMALKGVPKSEEFKQKLADYWRQHPERREEATAILLANKSCDGMLGKTHSEDTKKKMSQKHLGKIFTKKHRDNISEGRKKMLVKTGGFTRKHRENLSKAVLKQYANGFNPKLHHVNGWHESSKAGSVFYRSSYEKKAYLKLDKDDLVKTYYVEKVTTEFFNPIKEITSSYIIDILVQYIDNTEKLVEVKPAKWLTDAVVMAKIKAGKLKAKDMGIIYEVWTEMDLFGHVYNEKNMRLFVEKIRRGEI